MDLFASPPSSTTSFREPSWARRGVTLPELVIYLLLAGFAVQGLLVPARRQTDVMVLNAAREELVALLHQARMEARVRGEAAVVVYEGEDPALVLPGTDRIVRVPLAEKGVEVSVSGDRSAVELAYGPLGVSRFAPATLVLRRGSQEAELVISGYGRVRR